MIKFWDIILVAIMGIFASGCIHDPVPEYGVEPMYGVITSKQETTQEQNPEFFQE